MKRSIIALALIVAPLTAQAEVLSATPAGFALQQSVRTDLPPSAAYKRFLSIADWWSSEHTYSGSAKNLRIEPRAGGCWCEKLPNGGGVRHMELIYIEPGKTLRFTGALGPLQTKSVTGMMDVTFEGAGAGTKVTMTYSVGGNETGLDTLAPAVDRVLGEQLARYAGTP